MIGGSYEPGQDEGPAQFGGQTVRQAPGCGGGGAKWIVALLMAGFALFTFYSSKSVNPVTGEVQHIGNVTAEQEIALGLQAAPEMAQQFGGAEQGTQRSELVESVGRRILGRTRAGQTEYKFDFHLLRDPKTVNAFALPGGQVFITRALFDRLETEGQLAGVLGHEVAHVVCRHGAEHMAKAQLTQGLTGAAVIAAYDPNNPNSANSAGFVQLIGQMVNLKYGREDEIESDLFGVEFTSEAGYDPRGMIRVMEILKESAGGGRQPEFMSTHPDPENRIQRIEAAIAERFPSGVPELQK